MNKLMYSALFCGIATVLTGCGGGGPDLYQIVLNRQGLQSMDPKLESSQTISTCTIEGRRAKFGVVDISVNYLALGGTNSRHSMGKTYVIARELANGDVENYTASGEQQDQVSQIKDKWTQFWGCKIAT